MILTLVLCSFSLPFGKYFLKLNQQHTPHCLNGEWLNATAEQVAAILSLGEVL
jgi:hypothetical protein